MSQNKYKAKTDNDRMKLAVMAAYWRQMKPQGLMARKGVIEVMRKVREEKK